jgi:excisionase family DNA binding protein
MTHTENQTGFYCSTSFAAKKLGISTATLQKLADKNLFSSWKTPGGHRRIYFPSLVKYMENVKISNPVELKNKNITTILLIDEDQEILQKITSQNIKLNTPLKIFFANSLVDVLVKKLPQNPDLLIVNIKTNSKDKIEFLKMTLSSQPQTTAIAYNFKRPISGNLSDTKFKNITIINNLTEEWYHGFLSCFIQLKNQSKLENQ